MPGAYSIRIFLPNGEPNGLRILSRPNWTGTGVTFARTGFQEATKRKELSQAGVYVLVGNSEDSRRRSSSPNSPTWKAFSAICSACSL